MSEYECSMGWNCPACGSRESCSVPDEIELPFVTRCGKCRESFSIVRVVSPEGEFPQVIAKRVQK